MLRSLKHIILTLVAVAAAIGAAAENPVVLGNKRVTVITPTLYRMEYALDGKFVDEPTMFAWRRDTMLSPDSMTVTRVNDGKAVEINTGKLRLVVDDDNMPFGQINTKVYFTRRGKEASATGRPLHSKKRNLNLGGSIATLDNVRKEVPLDDGLLSDDGWQYVSDTGTDLMVDGWFKPRPESSIQDMYCFVYGDDFHAPFRDLGIISGRVPMTRKALHGVWYSRWYPYDDAYIDELVAGYRANGFPLDILSVDMDWHTQAEATVGAGHNFTKGWTGYTWNDTLITNPPALIARLHADSIAVVLNEHPHDGIRPHEACYAAFMRDMGYDPAKGETLLFDASDRKYMENFLHHSRAYNDSIGVDFYWVDWQQDYLYPRVRGSQMGHLKWLNRLCYEQTCSNGRRGAGYSRWGGWGDHRYPINFSGDATANWDVLTFEVKLSQTSGNQGCYYWAHDIGGFHGGTDPEMLVRWTQFGALSAALRVHAARGPKLDRRPWLWGDQATDAMRVTYGFRSEILPYIYSSVRKVHDTMLPLNRCMFVDYPTDSMAYNRYGQFLLGDLLLAAPITSPGRGENFRADKEVWFPGGDDWYDYFTDRCHRGGRTELVTKDIYTFPLFVRAGWLLPMQPWSAHPASAELSTLVMRLYPSRGDADNTFSLYEDDGISDRYEQGRCAFTPLRYTRKGDAVTVTVGPTEGEYDGQLDRRAARLQLAGVEGGIKNLKVNGRKARHSVDSLGRIFIEIPETSIRKAATVTFDLVDAPAPEMLKVGTTLAAFGGLSGVTPESLAAAREAGVTDIEISLTGLVNGDNPMPLSALKERFAQVKADADAASVNIRSIHMPYATDCDPSKADERVRKASEDAYRSYIDAVAVLEPEILLFHPSWRLGLNNREVYISQLVKTISALKPDADAIGATIVIENILGRKKLKGDELTRPLCHTVEEMERVMSLMPEGVLAAIDTNHITHPERLVEAMAGRIGSVHIADGDGLNERHLLPGKGSVDWDAVLEALHQGGYRGPFIYELREAEIPDFATLTQTYKSLYDHWVSNR